MLTGVTAMNVARAARGMCTRGRKDARAHAALGADHASPERRHRHVIRPCRHIKHSLVVADVAIHRERAHAVLAHVAERHGFGVFRHGGNVAVGPADREAAVCLSSPGLPSRNG
jgi:hypothetical protein